MHTNAHENGKAVIATKYTKKKTVTPPHEKLAFVVHPLLNGRTAALPCGRAHARHPRTAFSSLLPIPYGKLAFVVHPLLNGRTADLPCGRAHARHPRTAFSSLFPMKNWHSWFSLLNGRVAELPRGRAHARHPRTAFSSLFPSPYPTEAHCIVSTHYLLLPPPYSLLCTPFSSLLPVPYFFFFLVEKFGGMYILSVLTPALPGVRCGIVRPR